MKRYTHTVRIVIALCVICALSIAFVLPLYGCGGKTAEDAVYATDGNGYRYEEGGWTYLHLEGSPYECGYQHGFLMANEIEQCLTLTKQRVEAQYGVTWDYLKTTANGAWAGTLPEGITSELQGIVAGAGSKGVIFDFADILAWNAYDELIGSVLPRVKGDYAAGLEAQVFGGTPAADPNSGSCSAFIATGTYTREGNITVAHNTCREYVYGQYLNVMIDVKPSTGNHFIMQSAAGCVSSPTAYYSTEHLLITSTTIAGFSAYSINGIPSFARSRTAAQTATDFETFITTMQTSNTGGCASIWLVGNLATSEIMRFEQGVKYFDIQRTNDGAYYACNLATDVEIASFETSGISYSDSSTHGGARQVRFEKLLSDNKGKLDAGKAHDIISDHEDVYLEKGKSPCSRTICTHFELDNMEYSDEATPHAPRGTIDGVASTTTLARAFQVDARWGSACGMEFVASKFVEENPQYSNLLPYLIDRPKTEWVTLQKI